MSLVEMEINRLDNLAIAAENAGRAFYSENKDFRQCVIEAEKRYKSVFERECFVSGRNQAFWGR